MPKIEFVSYNGSYPNLCSGTLVLRIDGTEREFPPGCMNSGGRIWFDKDWREHIEYGAWTVRVPSDLKYCEEEINACVNANVIPGCCGGCV